MSLRLHRESWNISRTANRPSIRETRSWTVPITMTQFPFALEVDVEWPFRASRRPLSTTGAECEILFYSNFCSINHPYANLFVLITWTYIIGEQCIYVKGYHKPQLHTVLMDLAVLEIEVLNDQGVEVAAVDDGKNDPLVITHAGTMDWVRKCRKDCSVGRLPSAI